MKTKLIFALSVFLFSGSMLFAQNKFSKVEMSDIQQHKYQLELDVKNIFNGLSGASIIFKKILKPKEGKSNNSIRLLRAFGNFSGDLSLQKEDFETQEEVNTSFSSRDHLGIGLGLGFEKQVMHKNFVHSFGVDGRVSYNGQKNYNSNVGPLGLNVSTQTSTSKQILVGINPFFGIKYYFTDRLSLGVETGLAVLYERQKNKDSSYQKNEQPNGVITIHTSERSPEPNHGIIMQFNNVRFASVGYSF